LLRHFQALINVLAKDNTIAACWCAQLDCQYTTELTPPADLNALVRFAERRNLVSARVPSHFKRSLPDNRFPTFRDNVLSLSFKSRYFDIWRWGK
jgi:hypothetical protein